jgi:phage shock protein PspC (stress-responsive transcriptional regulator)
MTEKKLKRSSNAMIAGVAAGVAEYFGLDVNLVRIIWAICTIFGGAGLIVYLICLLIMPKA